MSHEAHIGLCSLYFIAIELHIPFPTPSKEETYVLLQALVGFFFSITEAGNNEVVCNYFYALKTLYQFMHVLCLTSGAELMPKGMRSRR